MYVIFPADEVVYLTYGTNSPPVRPRPTLDHLLEPRVPLRRPLTPEDPPSSTTDSFKDRDVYNYTGPDVSANRTPTSSPPLSRPPSSRGGILLQPQQQQQQGEKLKEKKHRFLRLKKAEDPNFGRIQRSPNIYNYEQPVPLATPAFSKRNIFDQNFDALFEVSNAPEFTENIRVVTPEPPRSGSVQFDTQDYAYSLIEEPTTPEDDWRLSEEVVKHSSMSSLRLPPLSAPSTPKSDRKNARQSRKTTAVDKASSFEEASPRKKSGFLSRIRRQSSEGRRMASGQAAADAVLRDLTNPNINEHLKNHNAVSFKLVKTVSDFTSQLSQMYEQQAGELQMLVATYRKKNSELRKERPACPSSLFHTWETLLQEVEADSQAHSDVASALNRQVSRPLVERSFHRKLQSRKVFAHREGYEAIITKTEETLTKCRQEYKAAHQAYVQSPSQATLAGYMDGHNAYVQQLHATNGMLDEYNQETLPQLLQELEDIYNDLCNTLSDAVLQGAEVVASRASDQARRYETLGAQCRAVNGTTDLAHLARGLPQTAPARAPRRAFAPPHGPSHHENDNNNADVPPESLPPPLKDELVLERLGPMQIRSNYDSLKKEALDLELQIKQQQESLDNMVRMQQRSIENHLYNKVNELQEDISMKKFDLRVSQIHLSAVRAQKELFAAKTDAGNVDRKLSSSSSGSMKNKWLKAFKSLKPTNSTSQPTQSSQNIDKKNGSGKDMRSSGDMESHNFMEYTYKKITPCDICSQVLRGHTRQGLRCKLCKMNVHSDCMGSTGKCQTKTKLLRRQKSTSEIEARIQDQPFDEEIDPAGWEPGQRLVRTLSFKESIEFLDESPEVDATYQVLKHANEMSRPEGRPGPTGGPPSRAPTTLSVHQPQIASNSGVVTRFQDIRAKRRLFAGMKSFSMFGSRSRNGSPHHRSISLPESNMLKSSTSLMLRQSESASPIAAPHSPRRQKLNLRMKSLSLDSTESPEQRRRPGARSEGPGPGPGSALGHPLALNTARLHCANAELGLLHVRRSKHVTYNHTTNAKSNSTPSSPVHNRRLLSARNMRMSSVELPDEHDKSLSSASTSPCPSPVKQKSHRLLPSNLYVILYNFESRHPDELDLKAGYKVTVIDASNPDWWKGKCLGRVGYFPSKYCTKLQAGEKPLQVTHNLQVSDGENGLMLLRDQIVIQVGEEVDGMVMIRSGDNRQGVCPMQFLQEV